MSPQGRRIHRFTQVAAEIEGLFAQVEEAVAKIQSGPIDEAAGRSGGAAGEVAFLRQGGADCVVIERFEVPSAFPPHASSVCRSISPLGLNRAGVDLANGDGGTTCVGDVLVDMAATTGELSKSVQGAQALFMGSPPQTTKANVHRRKGFFAIAEGERGGAWIVVGALGVVALLDVSMRHIVTALLIGEERAGVGPENRWLIGG